MRLCLNASVPVTAVGIAAPAIIVVGVRPWAAVQRAEARVVEDRPESVFRIKTLPQEFSTRERKCSHILSAQG